MPIEARPTPALVSGFKEWLSDLGLELGRSEMDAIMLRNVGTRTGWVEIHASLVRELVRAFLRASAAHEPKRWRRGEIAYVYGKLLPERCSERHREREDEERGRRRGREDQERADIGVGMSIANVDHNHRP